MSSSNYPFAQNLAAGAAALPSSAYNSLSSNSNRSLRCHDYPSRPQIAKPLVSPSYAAKNSIGDKGLLHFSDQHYASRQTMTTAAETSCSRLSKSEGADQSERHQHQQQHSLDWQRRSEENAAFVKMLEEESLMLQDGRPSRRSRNQNQQQPRQSNPPPREHLPATQLPQDLSIVHEVRSSSGHQLQQQGGGPPALPDDIPSRDFHQSKHSLERERPGYPSNRNPEDPHRNGSFSEQQDGRQHLSQQEIFQRQLQGSLSSSPQRQLRNANARDNHLNNDRTLIDHMQTLQMRDVTPEQQYQQQQQLQGRRGRMLDHNPGEAENYMRNSYNSRDRAGGEAENYMRNSYNSRDRADGNNNSRRGVDYYDYNEGQVYNENAFAPALEDLHHQRRPERFPPQDYLHYHQPHPHPHPHQYAPMDHAMVMQLLPPVEYIEFPTDWQGLEIEATEDDDILERDEDDFRRRYRAQQQQRRQHHQQRGPALRCNSGLSRESNADSIRPPGARRNMTIEVSPGVNMPFRGSEETWKAFQENRICQSKCMGCDIPLYCVEDAELVICPDCQTLSPVVLAGGNPGETNRNIRRSGVGLGFKEEALLQWHTTL